jgi:hypothetical protein
MEPHLERIERQLAAAIDQQLAVDREARCRQPPEHRDDLGKVAAERLARLGP